MPPCSTANSSSKTPNWSSRTAATATPRSTSTASSSSKTERKTLQAEVEEAQPPGQRGLQVDRQGQGRRPSARPARKKAAAPRADRRDPEAGRPIWPPRRTPSSATIPNLSHPDAPVGVDDKANLELFRGKTPLAAVRLQAAGPRRAGREAGPDRLRGRRPRGRPRLLLPQERGRAAGIGLAALRPGGAAGRRLHAHDHARPGPQRDPRRASASFPAGRKRRSTASKAAI